MTQAELASLASYMRGRLTLDRVNAALDEAALHAEQLARWMGAVRAHQLSRVPADERKRAADIFHMLAVRMAGGGGGGRWGVGDGDGWVTY